MRQVSSVASSYSLAGLAALRSPLAASMVLADYFDETRPVEAGLRRAWQMHAASGGTMAVRQVALVHSSMREGVNASGKGRGKLHTVYQARDLTLALTLTKLHTIYEVHSVAVSNYRVCSL